MRRAAEVVDHYAAAVFAEVGARHWRNGEVHKSAASVGRHTALAVVHTAVVELIEVGDVGVCAVVDGVHRAVNLVSVGIYNEVVEGYFETNEEHPSEREASLSAVHAVALAVQLGYEHGVVAAHGYAVAHLKVSLSLLAQFLVYWRDAAVCGRDAVAVRYLYRADLRVHGLSGG